VHQMLSCAHLISGRGCKSIPAKVAPQGRHSQAAGTATGAALRMPGYLAFRVFWC
jgi:hypothetical protein